MSAAQNSSPVHSQGLILGAVAGGILLMAVYLTSSIIENQNGGISAAVRTVGIGLAIWSLVRPRAGLYIVSVEAFSLDYVKKIAVYYGTVSMGTIIEVLVVGMLAVLATIVGLLLQSVALRRFKLAPIQWGVLAAAILASIAMVASGFKTVGLEKAAEDAFNGFAYVAIALPICVFLVDRTQISKLIQLQFFLATLWAILGIKQYYYGFSPLEWFYAETGLSVVASEHMLRFDFPRPFGFGTGVANYSMLPAYCCYGVWHLISNSRRKLLFALCTAILFWGLVTSLQRTPLVMPLFVLLFYFCLQTMRRAVVAYALCAAVFLLAVINAEYLYNHLGDINDAISMQGFWGENTLVVGTYSERLWSWMALKDPATYSVFGLKDGVSNAHDVFTSILSAYGVVGLVLSLGTMAWGAWFVQRTILRVEDPTDRKFALFCFSVTITVLALGFVGGSNFAVIPVNLALWTFFGGALSMVVNSRLADVPIYHQSVRAVLQMLETNKPKIPLAARAGMVQQEPA